MKMLIANICITVGLFPVIWFMFKGWITIKGGTEEQKKVILRFMFVIYTLIYAGLALKIIW